MRVDTASKRIHAPAAAIYHAFADPKAMDKWLPPSGMTGKMLSFAFHEGGHYRMRLTYEHPPETGGKTSDDSDETEVRIVKLVENRSIEQAVTFESDDPAFQGEMRLTWTLEPNADGTLVTVACDHVPPGISARDHEEALNSTLGNLAAYVEKKTV